MSFLDVLPLPGEMVVVAEKGTCPRAYVSVLLHDVHMFPGRISLWPLWRGNIINLWTSDFPWRRTAGRPIQRVPSTHTDAHVHVHEGVHMS